MTYTLLCGPFTLCSWEHDDLRIARMIASFPGEPCFFVCCGHMATFFLSSVTAGRVCTAPRDRLEGWHDRDASTPRGGIFDPFPQDPACCRGWRTHRASVLATHVGTPAARQIHTHRPTHPALHLVPTTVWDRVGTGRFVSAKASSIVLVSLSVQSSCFF